MLLSMRKTHYKDEFNANRSSLSNEENSNPLGFSVRVHWCSGKMRQAAAGSSVSHFRQERWRGYILGLIGVARD